jgi:hypothetical protein
MPIPIRGALASALNLIVFADVDASYVSGMELGGQQFTITANTQKPLAVNGIVDVSNVGVLRLRSAATEWLCLTYMSPKKNRTVSMHTYICARS